MGLCVTNPNRAGLWRQSYDCSAGTERVNEYPFFRIQVNKLIQSSPPPFSIDQTVLSDQRQRIHNYDKTQFDTSWRFEDI